MPSFCTFEIKNIFFPMHVVVIFLLVVCVSHVVATQCGPNEVKIPCGSTSCEKSCKNRKIRCFDSCDLGCPCRAGFFRKGDHNTECVEDHECDDNGGGII